MSPRLRIAVAALLFSTGGIAIKAIELNGYQVVCFRSGIAALTLFLLVPGARRGFTARAFLVGIAYAATVISFVLATRMTTSANVIYLQSAAPLYLLLLGPWLLKEPVRRRDLPVVAAVICGLILVFLGNDAPSTTAPNPAGGNLLAAFSGIAYAFLLAGLRGIGKHHADTANTVAAVITGNLIAFVAMLPVALPLTSVSAASVAGILYLGIFQLGASYVLVTRGLREVPALDASLLLLVETAFNPVWVWLFLGEVPTMLAIIGGVVIVFATLLQSLRSPAPPDIVEAA